MWGNFPHSYVLAASHTHFHNETSGVLWERGRCSSHKVIDSDGSNIHPPNINHMSSSGDNCHWYAKMFESILCQKKKKKKNTSKTASGNASAWVIWRHIGEKIQASFSRCYPLQVYSLVSWISSNGTYSLARNISSLNLSYIFRNSLRFSHSLRS